MSQRSISRVNTALVAALARARRNGPDADDSMQIAVLEQLERGSLQPELLPGRAKRRRQDALRRQQRERNRVRDLDVADLPSAGTVHEDERRAAAERERQRQVARLIEAVERDYPTGDLPLDDHNVQQLSRVAGEGLLAGVERADEDRIEQLAGLTPGERIAVIAGWIEERESIWLRLRGTTMGVRLAYQEIGDLLADLARRKRWTRALADRAL